MKNMQELPTSASDTGDASDDVPAVWPYFDAEQRRAADEVLATGRVNYWTGEQGRLFEQEFAAYFGTRFGIALSNGTVALELALRALDIGPGDEVIVTPRTFVASASCVIAQGASPVFADVDPRSQNMTADSIRGVLSRNTRAVIVVHLAGWPCDMESIKALADERGLALIEDCAQAHGARYRGSYAGTFGDLATFSFCQDKIMTTAGEGGMILTNSERLMESVWAMKDHGKNRRKMSEPAAGHGFRWVHDSIGTNARMTEVQAAVGRVQLKRLDSWLAIRRRNAGILAAELSGKDVVDVYAPPSDIEHAYYKFYCFVNPDRLAPGWDRDRILTEINSAGVPALAGSCSEVYLEKAFEALNYRPANPLPVARQLGERSLMFQVHPTLTASAMKDSASIIGDVIRRAGGG